MHIFKYIALENFIQPTEVKGRAPPKNGCSLSLRPRIRGDLPRRVREHGGPDLSDVPLRFIELRATSLTRPRPLVVPQMDGRINSHGRISKEAEVPSGQTRMKVH